MNPFPIWKTERKPRRARWCKTHPPCSVLRTSALFAMRAQLHSQLRRRADVAGGRCPTEPAPSERSPFLFLGKPLPPHHPHECWLADTGFLCLYHRAGCRTRAQDQTEKALVGQAANPITCMLPQPHVKLLVMNAATCDVSGTTPPCEFISPLHSCSNSFWNTSDDNEKKNLVFNSWLFPPTPFTRGRKPQTVRQAIIGGDTVLSYWLSFLIDNYRYSASRGPVINIAAHLTYQIYLFGKI